MHVTVKTELRISSLPIHCHFLQLKNLSFVDQLIEIFLYFIVYFNFHLEKYDVKIHLIVFFY